MLLGSELPGCSGTKSSNLASQLQDNCLDPGPDFRDGKRGRDLAPNIRVPPTC